MIIIIKYINQLNDDCHITVSLIKEYWYCPLKVCFEIDNNNNNNNNMKNNPLLTSGIFHEAQIGFEEL